MSTLIVDTHIMIWDQLDPGKLSQKAKKAIELADKHHQIIVCEISLWEIAILIKKKRLVIDMTYLDFMDQILHSRNYLLQGINPEIANLASEVAIDTKDPADKLIVATSIFLGHPLVSIDRFMRESSGIKTIW